MCEVQFLKRFLQIIINGEEGELYLNLRIINLPFSIDRLFLVTVRGRKIRGTILDHFKRDKVNGGFPEAFVIIMSKKMSMSVLEAEKYLYFKKNLLGMVIK